jgi:hypothetical protein
VEYASGGVPLPLLVAHESGHSVAANDDQHQRQLVSANHPAQQRNLIDGEPTFAAGRQFEYHVLPINDGVNALSKVP